MNKWLSGIFLFGLAATTLAVGQEYPYDDPYPVIPQVKRKRDLPGAQQVPIERPGRRDKRSDTVFGVNLQAGGSYTVLQQRFEDNTTATASGPGFGVALGFGWDLENAPVSLEIESGFQQILLGTSAKTTVVPLKFSTYYWSKLSEDAVIRVGLGSSLDFRSTDYSKGVFPGWHLSFIYEYASFTFEPSVEVMRIRNGDNFVLGAFYFGYRI